MAFMLSRLRLNGFNDLIVTLSRAKNRQSPSRRQEWNKMMMIQFLSSNGCNPKDFSMLGVMDARHPEHLRQKQLTPLANGKDRWLAIKLLFMVVYAVFDLYLH